VLVYAVAGKPLLEAVFGDDLTLASDALPWLGLAMVLLACTYLSVQYLLALHRYRFTWVLAAAMVVEVAALVAIGDDLTRVAMALVAVQALCAAAVLFLALERQPAPVAPDPVAEPAPMAASLVESRS
jgi:O-antigen/teichoic acid export membrane protein